MKEIFYEESSKLQNRKSARTKYNVCNVITAITIILLLAWVYLLFIGFEFARGSVALNIVFAVLPIMVFITSAILITRYKRKLFVDYDYTFISGTIRISKIIKEIKRYDIVSFETTSIEKIGKINSDTYNTYLKSTNITKKVLTSNNKAEEGKGFFYIVANNNGKSIYIIETTPEFISNVLQYTTRLVLEEGFKLWFILTTLQPPFHLKLH